MTSAKSSAKLFSALRRDTSKPIWLMMIPAGILAVINFIDCLNTFSFFDKIFEDIKYAKPSDGNVYFKFLEIGPVTYFIMIMFACLFGLITFSFVSSKKQCNVYYSLGVKRRDLFLGKYFGGFVPLVTSITVFYVLNLVANLMLFYATRQMIIAFLFNYLSALVTMLCAYSVTALAFCAACNIIEGIIFTGILGVSVPIFVYGVEAVAGHLVFGSAYGTMAHYSTMNYTQKLWFLDVFGSFSEKSNKYKLARGIPASKFVTPDFLGVIAGAVICVGIVLFAIKLFRKNSSENAGTVLKSYTLYKMTAVIAGFGSFVTATTVFYANGISRYISAALSIVISALILCGIYLIFIRKNPLKTAGVYAAVLAVFSFACFIGFNNSLPDREDIEEAYIAPSVYSNLVEMNTSKYWFNFEEEGSVFNYYVEYQNDSLPMIKLTADKDIDWALDVSRSIVDYGYHSKLSDDNAHLDFLVKFKLKNGKYVVRKYTVMDNETYLKALSFTETEAAQRLNDITYGMMKNGNDDGTAYDPDEPFMSYYDNGSIDFESGNLEKYFGFIWYYVTDNYSDGFDSSMTSAFSETYSYNAVISDTNGKYLKTVDNIDSRSEFIKALYEDEKAVSAKDRFFHKAEDELCTVSLAAINYSDFNFNEDFSVSSYAQDCTALSGNDYLAAVNYYAYVNFDRIADNNNSAGTFIDVAETITEALDMEYALNDDDEGYYEYDILNPDEEEEAKIDKKLKHSNYAKFFRKAFGMEYTYKNIRKACAQIVEFFRENKDGAYSFCANSGLFHMSNYLVVTKQMKNTVKYLESTGIDFETVKSDGTPVKVRIDKFSNCFGGSLNFATDVVDLYRMYRVNPKYTVNGYYFNFSDTIRDYFEKAVTVTDKSDMTELLNESVAYNRKVIGCYIAEFTFADGEVLTKLIPADVAQKIINK